ncbi:hypothetical protein VE00_09480 [Pseudogymnoascus sp. WSF 3629]|nr:hypothetical protein VE00_09480 [Pseudogymnoascus sp. WSF 3629]
MAHDPEITGLEIKVKHLETNLRRAIEQLQRCASCRLSLVNCQPDWFEAISDSRNPLPQEVSNLNDVPPQATYLVDTIRNSSYLPSQSRCQVDNIRNSNSSDLPPQGPHQVDNIRNSNSSDLPPQGPHQVDNIRNSNSSDLPPQGPRQGKSNNIPTRQPCQDDAINSLNDVPGLQINIYDPHTANLKAASSQPTKQKSSQTLKANIDELVGKISTAKPITQHTNNYWEHRIRSILSGVSVCNRVTPSSSTAEGSLRDFARITKATEKVTEFARQVHAFQELIFVSACFVLTASGVKTSEVNSIMQLCVSDSKDAHLRRLRRGSQWANEQMSKMCPTLEHLAMDYIFHSPMSVNKYCILGQSPTESNNYLSKHVMPAKVAPKKLPSLPQAYIPLSVPSLVQVMLGGHYTLRKVCEKLKVPDSYVNEKTISLCRRYTAIRDAPSQECSLLSPEYRKRTMDELPGSSGKSKKHRGNEPSTSSTPTECPSAAFARDKDGVAGEINRTTQSQGPTDEGNHPPEDTDGLIPLLDHIVQGSSSHGNNSNTYGSSVATGADTGLRALARVAELDSTGYDRSIGSSSIVQNSTGIDVYYPLDLINSLHYPQSGIDAINSLEQSEIDLINSLHYPQSGIDLTNSLHYHQPDIDAINSLQQSDIDLINSLHYPQSDLNQISTPQSDHQADIEVVNSRYQQHLDYH